jgi:mannose-1-phosphate guanylyltransferase
MKPVKSLERDLTPSYEPGPGNHPVEVHPMEKLAVIMAGGSGIRLWPLSRENRPKQFISIGKKKSMLLRTVERLKGVIDADRCYVVTGTDQKSMVMEALKDLIPPSHILLEPLRKNTAACITYAAMVLKNEHKEGLLCCIPSDSWIKEEEGYKAALETACREAKAKNRIAVIGVTPTFPATGYGYIKADTGKPAAGEDVYPVLQFLEKPSMEKAGEFIASGEYLWNSGIVTGTLDSILNNVESFLPGLFHRLSGAVRLTDEAEKSAALEKAYREIDAVSFDRGVLEKSMQISVVKGNFGWSDIGSLDAMDSMLGTDSMGNAVEGNYAGIETCNSVIYSGNNLVATIGLENMIVVNTGDVVLVCPRERAQEIRELVELLRRDGYEQYL